MRTNESGRGVPRRFFSHQEFSRSRHGFFFFGENNVPGRFGSGSARLAFLRTESWASAFAPPFPHGEMDWLRLTTWLVRVEVSGLGTKVSTEGTEGRGENYPRGRTLSPWPPPNGVLDRLRGIGRSVCKLGVRSQAIPDS